MAEPDVTQVIAGPAVVYVAALGSTLPTLDGHGEYPIVWPVAWKAIGYTDGGVDAVYTPTFKEIDVDEEASPVGDILTKEKYEIKLTFAEATLKNYSASISACTYTDDSAANEAIFVKGGQNGNPVQYPLTYTMVGVQGPAPGTNLARIIILQKALPSGAVSLKMTRKDNQKFGVTFSARRINGQPLYQLTDLTVGAS